MDTRAPKETASTFDVAGSVAILELAPGLPAESLNLKSTEDCRFSPDGTVLAIAGFGKSSIILFTVEHRRESGRVYVTLTGKLTLTHASLAYPHGVDFIDNKTIAVANRKGRLVVLSIPDLPYDGQIQEACLEIEVDHKETQLRMISPGSVAVVAKKWRRYSMLVCHNYRHRVVREDIRVHRGKHRVARGRLIVRDGLDIPDGISVCRKSKRLAVANHNEHAVRVYQSFKSVKPDSQPVGRLLGAAYPHGIRFFDRGRHFLVADAGQPFVHYYHDPRGTWQGDRMPTASFRVMDDETFTRGRQNPQEGGPKGVDVHPSGDFFVVTSEQQALAAFDLRALLHDVQQRSAAPVEELPEQSDTDPTQ